MTFKRPESVLVLVYSRDGQVLLLNRRSPAGFWQSVTGSLKWGEDKLSAARRELLEETGIDAVDLIDKATQHVFPILPEWRDRYADNISENTEYLLSLELEKPVDIILNPEEHSEYVWLPIAEAAEKVFSWTNRDAILALHT